MVCVATWVGIQVCITMARSPTHPPNLDSPPLNVVKPIMGNLIL